MTTPLRNFQAVVEVADLVDDNGLVGNPKLELEDGLAPQFADLASNGALLYLWPPDVPLAYSAKAYLDGNLDDLHGWLMQWIPSRCSAKGMLDAFVRIHSAADVLKFAKRFGVMGCCSHYLPSAHQNRLAYGELCEPMPFPFSRGTPLHWEPINIWLALAEGARSLLKVVSAMYEGREIETTDWEKAITAVYKPYPPGLFPVLTSRENGRGTICFLVEQWLALGGASHGLRWLEHSETPEVRLLIRDTGQPPTVAILGSQLMLAVARASELAVCSGCSSIYRRKRRPQARRRNYCGNCQADGVPNRDRQRAHRARAVT